MEFVSCCFQ